MLALLDAIGWHLPVRAAMQSGGYDQAQHAEGWRLLQAACGHAADAPMVELQAHVREAIAKVDAWDNEALSTVRETLWQPHREVAQFLLDGLDASDGTSAARAEVLLNRLDQLESGNDRPVTRREDTEAVELLAARGIERQVRTQIRVSVDTVRSASRLPEGSTLTANPDAAHEAALKELRTWYDVWSEIARAAVTRRAQRIHIGLAARRDLRDQADAADRDDDTDDWPRS